MKNHKLAAGVALLVGCGFANSALSYAMSGESSGGGDGIAAHYSGVAKRALGAARIVCRGIDNPDQEAAKACSYVAPLELAVNSMKVEPRSRDTVLGPDGQPRDAGNDGNQKVFLDIDRWMDKLNETDPNKTLEARTMQVKIALHEPLVLAGAETNDQYTISGKLADLMDKSNFDFSRLVGKPAMISAPLKIQPTLIYEYFEGEASANSNGFAGAWVEAEADAIKQASKAGFLDCTRARYWTSVSYWMQTTSCHIQVKCARPATVAGGL